MLALVGLGTLVACLLLLRAFCPRPGQVVSRSEWIDVSVAIVVTAGIAVGVTLTIVGVGTWFS